MDNKVKIFWMLRYMVAFAVLIIGIFFATSKRYFDTSYDLIESFDEIKPIEFRQGDVVEQSVLFAYDKIQSVGICIVERTRDCSGTINIDLFDGNSNLIWQQEISAESIPMQYINWFGADLRIEQGRNHVLRISSESLKGSVYIGAVEEEESSDLTVTTAIMNGEGLAYPLVVEASFRGRLDVRMRVILLIWTIIVVVYVVGVEKLFKDKKTAVSTIFLTVDVALISIYFRAGFEFNESLNYIMFSGMVFALFVVAAIYMCMLFKNVNKVEIYFAISTFILGIVYSIILPPYSMPDEGFHFAQSYRLSNAIMGQPINDEQGYIYMRECDINPREYFPNNSYTIDMIKALIRGNNDRTENMEASECRREAAGPILMYVPQAIGITIGRLLHFNYARLIYMSRFMSLIVFIIITYWAIKIIPCGKWIFFAICQIPMVLETVSSCSYDTPILALAFCYTAYLLRLCVQTNKVHMRQIGILTFLGMLFAPLKPVYAPLVALVFLLPDKNISDYKLKSRACKIMVVTMALTSVVLTYKFSVGSMSRVKNELTYAGSEEIQETHEEIELKTVYSIENNMPYKWPSIQYMIENPFNLIESLMGSYIVYADEYWMALIGCGLGALWDLRNPAFIGILTLLLIYISFKRDCGSNDFIVDLKGKLWAIILAAGSIFGIFLAMYFYYSTPRSKVIGGVQGRYMLPLLTILPFFLRRNEDGNKRANTSVVMLSLTVQILAVLHAAMQVWNR